MSMSIYSILSLAVLSFLYFLLLFHLFLFVVIHAQKTHQEVRYEWRGWGRDRRNGENGRALVDMA